MKKRRAFSLIELLIVIAIMGILASAMILTMGGTTDKAEATRIVSELQSLKAAAALCYADRVGTADSNKAPTLNELAAYLEGSKKLLDAPDGTASSYQIYPADGASSSTWFVGYTALEADSGVAQRLEKMASQQGLLKGNTAGAPSEEYTQDSTSLWLRVR